MGMRLDVLDGGIGLTDIEFMKIVVVNTRHLRRRFAGNAFPLVQVADLLVGLPIGLVKFREPGMREPARVVVGIDTRIVGGEFLHLIEAVFDGIEFGLIPHMPFAGVVGGVAVFLEEFGNRRCVLCRLPEPPRPIEPSGSGCVRS